MLAAWEEMGATVVASITDDLLTVGPPHTLPYVWFLLFDVPSLDVVADTTGNVVLARATRDIQDSVRQGESVTAPLRAPTSGAPARTVTLSPGLNGFVRTKLAPCPSECDLSTPVWAPVFEPVTCTVPSPLGGTPRKLIWVCGEATGVPAVGAFPSYFAT